MKIPYLLTCTFALTTGGALTAQPGLVGQADWYQVTSTGVMVNEQHNASTEELFATKAKYLPDDWHMGTIETNEGQQISGYRIRFNLSNRTVEVLSADDLQRVVIPGERIKRFTFLKYTRGTEDRTLTAGREYAVEGVPLTGFVEELVTGDRSLYLQPGVKVHKANYSVMHDVGSRSDRVTRDDNFYYTLGNDKRSLLPLPRGRRKLFAIFGEHAKAVAERAQQYAWSPQEREDLTAMFR
ncbi:MAG: hypothetical protein WBA12_06900, partial [Catalinimonas sp.]